jgi:hypothetical protein
MQWSSTIGMVCFDDSYESHFLNSEVVNCIITLTPNLNLEMLFDAFTQPGSTCNSCLCACIRKE